MQRGNVGRSLRFLRRRAGLTQTALGGRVGLSRESVSRVERGAADVLTLGALRRIAAALNAELAIEIRWQRDRLERLMDAGHAQLQELVMGSIRRGGGLAEAEVCFNWYGDRGRYDALAYYSSTGTLFVVEVKTRLVDIQDMLGRLDVKARLAPHAARNLGWPAPRRVVPCLVIAEGSTARRIVSAHAELFARFPLRGRAARAWLANPTNEHVRGLLLFESLANSHRVTRGQRQAGPASLASRDA